jgi:endogenous inhibitor of DNA gyrase (YacG/DUF329 family)
MSKKRPSAAALRSQAHWSTPEGKSLQTYCCQQRMPRGAIKANLSNQAPNNSYGPPMWYDDRKVKCKDCGQEFTWSAKAQQRWFEVLKMPIYAIAVRCVPCGRKVRLAKDAQKKHMADMARRPSRHNEAFFRAAPQSESRKQ